MTKTARYTRLKRRCVDALHRWQLLTKLDLERAQSAWLLCVGWTRALVEFERETPALECGCGQSYNLEQWNHLRRAGIMESGEERPAALELRYCLCGSTRAIGLDAGGEIIL